MVQRTLSGFVTAFWFAVGIGCAVALTPPIFDLTIHLGFEFDFLRTFRRILLLAVVIVLAFRLKPWKDGNLASYGLSFSRENTGAALGAYVLTVAAIAALIQVEMSAGWMKWQLRPDYISRALRYALSGFVIAFLEELFFRGWMLRRMTRAKGVFVALVGTNVIYALAHGFKPRHVTVDVADTWQGALMALGLWARHLLSPTFWPSILGLFLFGLLLSALFLRTGSLWPSLGVHAAAVLMLHGIVPSLRGTSPPDWAGTKMMYDGLPGWLLLSTAALLIWRMQKQQGEESRGTVPAD